MHFGAEFEGTVWRGVIWARAQVCSYRYLGWHGVKTISTGWLCSVHSVCEDGFKPVRQAHATIERVGGYRLEGVELIQQSSCAYSWVGFASVTFLVEALHNIDVPVLMHERTVLKCVYVCVHLFVYVWAYASVCTVYCVYLYFIGIISMSKFVCTSVCVRFLRLCMWFPIPGEIIPALPCDEASTFRQQHRCNISWQKNPDISRSAPSVGRGLAGKGGGVRVCWDGAFNWDCLPNKVARDQGAQQLALGPHLQKGLTIKLHVRDGCVGRNPCRGCYL